MRKQPIDRILGPLETFAAREASGGIVLISDAPGPSLGELWPVHSYERFFETPVSLGFGDWSIAKSLHHWINDGLMTIFFLVVGLEIKRELLGRGARLVSKGGASGCRSTRRNARTGASVSSAFNAGTPTQAGWGIPMATDIAFVIGVLALLGNRAPVGLKVF